MYVSVHIIATMSNQACGSASSFAGTAVVVNVSNQALLGSSIAEQGNVSDAVSQVVKVLHCSAVIPLYTAADRFEEIVVSLVSGTVPKPQAVFVCLVSLNF